MQVHYNIGKNAADQGDTNEAVIYYQQAIRLVGHLEIDTKDQNWTRNSYPNS